jgi:hypothetical protein
MADSASDAVAAAYSRLKRLVADRFAGNKSAEVALSEHESDPETWRTPLAKTLAATGTIADESVIVAAQQLMALLDAAGTQAGKYDVDLRGAQGVQVGKGNQQFNVYNAAPGIMVTSQELRSVRDSRVTRRVRAGVRGGRRRRVPRRRPRRGI